MADKKVTRQLSIFINDREVVNSLGGINKEIAKVNGQLRNLNKSEADYEIKQKELKDSLDKLRASQAQFREELFETSQVAGQASGSISKILMGLRSGDLELSREGFAGIKGEINGLVKSSLAFIATPIGAAIAALSGIVIGTKAIFDFNVEAEKSTVLLENLTGKTGQVVEDIRVKIKSLTDTFDVEFNALAGAVDNLIDTGAAKTELEALDKIKAGLLTAPDKNEFISSLESTAVAAKNIGAPLEEIIALKQEIEETGVDPEATFGALQKAGVNLSLQTDSLRKKLTEAFGAAFTDEILAKVKTGEITTIQALDKIGIKSTELNLNQTKQAELGRELFGKAAISAGGYGVVLETVNKSLIRQNTALNDNQQALSELEEANQRFNEVTSALFKVEGFSGFFDRLKANFLDFISTGLVLFDNLIGKLKLFYNITANVFINIKNFVLSTFQSIVSRISPILSALGVDVEKLNNKLQSLKSKNIDLKVTTTNEAVTETKTNNKSGSTQEEIAEQQRLRDAAAQKESEKSAANALKLKNDKERAQKEEYQRLLNFARAKQDLAKAELDYFIATNKSRLDSDKMLTPELLLQEQKRLENIKFNQENLLADERLLKLQKLEGEKLSAEEISIQKQIIDREYLTGKEILEQEFLVKTTANKKLFEEQQKQLALEQLAIENELELAEAGTKSEANKIKQRQDYEAELLGYKQLLDDKKITIDQYNKFVAIAKAKQADLDRITELQEIQGSLGGLNQLAGAVGELFGQSKELALVQAGINGAMAVTSILAQYPKFDGGFAMAAAIAAAAISTKNAISQINKQKAPKVPKFFYGGNTGANPMFGYDEYGPMTGVVHDQEWVAPKIMTQSPKYSATFSWLESERKNLVKNKFFDGGSATSGPVPVFDQSTNVNNDALVSAVNTLNSILQSGIIAKTFIGYPEAQGINDLMTDINNSNTNGTVSP